MRVVSEGPIKITDPTIDGAWKRRAADLRLIIRDAECRGLALVVNATSMRWAYSYRPRGTDPETGKRWPNQNVTIGNPATHSVKDARHEANRLKGTVASGGDPAAERRDKAEADNEKRASTLGRLIDLYTKRLPTRAKMRGTGIPSPRHVTSELTHVRAAITAMQAEATPAADLTERKIRRLLDTLAPHPATARARFGALSRFLDWCKDRGDLKLNPCDALSHQSRPKSVAARQGFLAPADMARLWHAAEALASTYRGLSRFLMVVPCRRGEAARLNWANLDLAAATWTQPGTMTKNGDPHRFHLPPLVLALLQSEHATAGQPKAGLVFPAPQSGKPVDTFSAIKASLDAAAGITNWIWHDFRRSFATAVAEAGIPEPVADAVLNHRQSATRGGVLGVYQRAQRWPEQVRAMEVWGNALAAAIEGKPAPANVVPLRMAAG